MTVINGTNNSVVTTTVPLAKPGALAFDPFCIAVNQRMNEVYVGNILSGGVTVIYANFATQVIPLTVPQYALVINPVTIESVSIRVFIWSVGCSFTDSTGI